MRFNFDKCIHGSVEGQVVTISHRNRTEKDTDQYPDPKHARTRTKTVKHFYSILVEMGRPLVALAVPLVPASLLTRCCLPLVSIAHHGSKLLNAPARDCFCDVDVAIRVDGCRVSECEMAAIMAGARQYAAYS